jgi:hypothetical protein
MKNWITILGKAGIVLVHIGLILLLFSFISQGMGGCNGSGSLFQGEIRTVGRLLELCPLQELEVAATVEEGGFIIGYLLETNCNFSYNTLRLDWTDNATAFQEFLMEYPDLVIWEEQIENGQYSKGFFSTRFIDATVVFYNPKQEIAYLTYEVDVNFLGPVDTTRNMALCAIPLGVLLALSRQLNMWKQRKHKLA